MGKGTEFSGIQRNLRELKNLMSSPSFPRVPHFSIIGLGLALLIGLLGTGCATSAPGHLEVRIKDHREAIGDFKELWLTFSGVGIHPTGQPRSEGWIEFEPSVERLDLTQYVKGREAVIVQTTLETGVYNAIRFHVDQVSVTLTNGQPVEVKVNFDTVALNFRAREGRTTIITLDLVVLDLTDHAGQSYELQVREAKVRGGE